MKINPKLAYFLTFKTITRADPWGVWLIFLIVGVIFWNMLFNSAIFAGITKAINEVKINTQFGELTIEPPANKSFITNTAEIKDFLLSFKEVEKVVPIVKTQATAINYKNKDGRDFARVGTIIEGIDLDQNYIFNLESKIIDGRFLKNDDSSKAIVGAGLAGGYVDSVFPDDLEGVTPGKKITIDFGNYKKEYEVVGIFKTKNIQMDRNIYIPKKELKRILGIPGDEISNKIIVRLSDKKDADKIKKVILDYFPNLQIKTWEENIAFGKGISKSFEVIGYILKAIGATVGGMVIFIVIFVDILNNKRQIGILKAIGISNSTIILEYVYKGLVYSFAGILLGLLFVFVSIFLISQHPIDMPMADVVPYLNLKDFISNLIFFFIAGLLGSFFPSYREIRKQILELLYK